MLCRDSKTLRGSDVCARNCRFISHLVLVIFLIISLYVLQKWVTTYAARTLLQPEAFSVVEWPVQSLDKKILCCVALICTAPRHSLSITLMYIHMYHMFLRFGFSCVSYQIRKTTDCASAGNAGNVFPATVSKRSWHASRHVRYARAVMHAAIAN